MNKYNTSRNPNKLTAREHRPLRFIVRQWVTEEDGTRYQIETGYHSRLESIKGMPSIYVQAVNNINYADYGNELILVEKF
jgi:hypothetical protein